MPREIATQIGNFYGVVAKDVNHRYRSWEHCFHHFQQRANFQTEEQIDTAALHLAFYLASWGMYRGSSALLWKDYKIHIPAVSILLEKKYSSLWGQDFSNDEGDSAMVDLITSLSDALKEIYRKTIKEVKGHPTHYEATDTLITKILLGTTGSTPACDRYFLSGLRQRGLKFSRFDRNFLHEVLRFYRKNAAEFLEAQDVILKDSGVRYPIMKLIDMYFWELGFSILSGAKGDEITSQD